MGVFIMIYLYHNKGPELKKSISLTFITHLRRLNLDLLYITHSTLNPVSQSLEPNNTKIPFGLAKTYTNILSPEFLQGGGVLCGFNVIMCWTLYVK